MNEGGGSHSYPPTFKDPALEQQFLECYRQLHNKDWFWRWGIFCKWFLFTVLRIPILYVENIVSLLKHGTLDQTPGSIERVVFPWGNIQLMALFTRVVAKSLLGQWSPTVRETQRLAFAI